MKGMMVRMVRIAALVVIALAFSMVAAAQKPANVAGKWELTGQGRQGPTTSTVTFEQDGEKLKGNIEGAQGGPAPLEGSVKGNKVTFKVTRQTPDGQTRTFEYEGTVEGDSMKGTRVMGDRKSDFTAKKIK